MRSCPPDDLVLTGLSPWRRREIYTPVASPYVETRGNLTVPRVIETSRVRVVFDQHLIDRSNRSLPVRAARHGCGWASARVLPAGREPQLRRRRPRVVPLLLGGGADNLLRDRDVAAVAQTLLERRFHPAVFAGGERQDGNPTPRSQASRQSTEERRQGPELIVHRDPERLEDSADEILHGTVRTAGPPGASLVHHCGKCLGGYERFACVCAMDCAGDFTGMG